jgi:hypothetical protein
VRTDTLLIVLAIGAGWWWWMNEKKKAKPKDNGKPAKISEEERTLRESEIK